MPLAAPVTTAARPSSRKTSSGIAHARILARGALTRVSDHGAERGRQARVALVVGVDAVGEALRAQQRQPLHEREPVVAGADPLADHGFESAAQVGERGAEPVAGVLGLVAQHRAHRDDRERRVLLAHDAQERVEPGAEQRGVVRRAPPAVGAVRDVITSAGSDAISSAEAISPRAPPA